jgi:acyl carrier protein
MNTEATVIQILENVLGVKNLDRNTRFLDVGGNSLNLVEVLKQLKDKTGVTPAPRIFFDKTNSSVAAISAAIDARLAETQSAAAVAAAE